MITLENLERLGRALKELRREVRMTQGEVCALAGIKASQLSRWENGHEKPTLESVVKVLGALRLDLADLQAVLAGSDREYAEASAKKERLSHEQRVRAAYLGALRARGEVYELQLEGVVPPLSGRYQAADRLEREALLELLTAASGQFVEPEEGYFARLSIRELWGHFRVLEPRFPRWVSEGGEAMEVLSGRDARERWGREEVRRSLRNAAPAGESQLDQLWELEQRLQALEERLGDDSD